MDGYVAIGGCDKNMPGSLMAMGRLNRPSIMVYGGTIRAGCTPRHPKLDVVSAFQAYGEFITGKDIDANEPFGKNVVEFNEDLQKQLKQLVIEIDKKDHCQKITA